MRFLFAFLFWLGLGALAAHDSILKPSALQGNWENAWSCRAVTWPTENLMELAPDKAIPLPPSHARARGIKVPRQPRNRPQPSIGNADKTIWRSRDKPKRRGKRSYFPSRALTPVANLHNGRNNSCDHRRYG